MRDAISTVSPRLRWSSASAAMVYDLPVPGGPTTSVSGSRAAEASARLCAWLSTAGTVPVSGSEAAGCVCGGAPSSAPTGGETVSASASSTRSKSTPRVSREFGINATAQAGTHRSAPRVARTTAFSSTSSG